MDRDSETLLLVVVAILLAVTVLPALASTWASGLDAWLLQHHVLIPGAQALFILPGMSGGPDLRRVIILGLALAVVIFLTASRTRRDSR